MNRLTFTIAATLHVAFVLAWWLFGAENELAFERWSVTIAVTVITISSGAFLVAYLWARKSLLNTSLAVYKAYMFLGFGLLFVPSVWGVLLHDPPYRGFGNPSSYWIAPAWLRTYLYVALAITSVWVWWEFLKVNSRPLADALSRSVRFGDGSSAATTAALERQADALERQADATERIADDVGLA